MEYEIITRAEAKEQGLKYYFTGKPCKYGHIDIRIASAGECRICSSLRSKKWHKRNPARASQLNKQYLQTHKDRLMPIRKKWREENKQKRCGYEAVRRSKINKAIPTSYSETSSGVISKIYQNCPDGYQVDHIVPINSDTVCGLHVACNLQYLLPSENASKGNRWWPNDWSDLHNES